MERVTKKHLDAVCNAINYHLGTPETAYTEIDGKWTANVGNFHVSQAYGGYCIYVMSNEAGGVHTPLMQGHIPARACYEQARAFLAGLVYRR